MPVGRARAVDQSAGIVTRNTNSWSGNECFNNATPSSTLSPLPLPPRHSAPLSAPFSPIPFPSPPTLPSCCLVPRAAEPGHGSQNLFSSADRCNFALSWQRRVHRSSDVSRPHLQSPCAYYALSLSLSSICSQLFPAKLFAFQSAPFCPRSAVYLPR